MVLCSWVCVPINNTSNQWILHLYFSDSQVQIFKECRGSFCPKHYFQIHCNAILYPHIFLCLYTTSRIHTRILWIDNDHSQFIYSEYTSKKRKIEIPEDSSLCKRSCQFQSSPCDVQAIINIVEPFCFQEQTRNLDVITLIFVKISHSSSASSMTQIKIT